MRCKHNLSQIKFSKRIIAESNQVDLTMENDSTIRPNNNRKRGPVPGSLPATSSPSQATSTGVERQDAVVEMPTTPGQLESMISIRATSAPASKDIMNNSSVPTLLL